MKSEEARGQQNFARGTQEGGTGPHLEGSLNPLAHASAPSFTRKKQILTARAQALARETRPRQAEEAALRVVEFFLAHERYAIEATYIREVYQLKDLTPLPCTPPFVLGIINVRGHILSVLDLKGFFALPQEGSRDQSPVIIIRADGMELGILTDGILGVRSIPLSTIEPPLPTLAGVRAEYLRGVTGEQLAILDAERILSDKRIIVDKEEVEI
jgi:purine-binding chemotaxis protein CheW